MGCSHLHRRDCSLLQSACLGSILCFWHESFSCLRSQADQPIQIPQAELSQSAACRYIKPFILIQLAVTVVLAIVTVFSTLLQVCCCVAQLQLCL